MSILIKGMEMPKSCYVCPFCDYVSARCDAVKGNPYTPESRYEKRADFCPLVPVPAHYDLIDHNALKIAVMDCDAETRIDFLKHAMDCINKAPVVIPSDLPTYEEEEGET